MCLIGAANNLTSTPNSIDGVLVVCPGSLISFSCTLSDNSDTLTHWFVRGTDSDSINCDEVVLHGVQTSTTCGPLNISMISNTSNSILSSTAQTVVTEALNGAIVGCSNGTLAFQVGNITVHVISEPFMLVHCS